MLAAVALPEVLGGGHGPVGAGSLDGARLPLGRVDLDGAALDAVLLGRPFSHIDHLGLLPAHRRAVVVVVDLVRRDRRHVRHLRPVCEYLHDVHLEAREGDRAARKLLDDVSGQIHRGLGRPEDFAVVGGDRRREHVEELPAVLQREVVQRVRDARIDPALHVRGRRELLVLAAARHIGRAERPDAAEHQAGGDAHHRPAALLLSS